MKNTGPVYYLYLTPYILLLLLGAWYDIHIKPIALFDGDTFGYLSPAIERQLSGVWHKGERPMQYLMFLYFTLTHNFKLNDIVRVQQMLALCGGGLLAAAWVTFVTSLKRNLFLWHLAGYIMLAIYVSSPNVMYYSQFIGPELFGMFFMCVLIYFLAAIFSSRAIDKTRAVFFATAIFVNLYLIDPMPKWVFAGIFLEVLLVWLLIKSGRITYRQKIYTLAISHLLYCLVVVAPEVLHPLESPQLDRVFIEYEQMAYTHFDLLAQDKTNFEIGGSVADSLVQYFHESQKSPYPLIGFSSDYLMWGKANNAVFEYYKYNYDSIGYFFKKLYYRLVTKYPLAITGQISKQVMAFYLPNNIYHKYLYGSANIAGTYADTRKMAIEFDPHMSQLIDTWQVRRHELLPRNLISCQYPPTFQQAGGQSYSALPLLFSNRFPFFYYFDYIFITSMILFFIARLWQRKYFELDYVTLLYILIGIYVVTISIVHTLDIGRFTDTIYPFLLLTPFMGFVYSGNEALLLLRQRWGARSENRCCT